MAVFVVTLEFGESVFINDVDRSTSVDHELEIDIVDFDLCVW